MDILAIVGSRSLTPTIALDSLPDAIVSGGATGVDQMAKSYAQHNGIPLIEIRPDYAKHGRKAPLVRNTEIAAKATRMLAFWDGESKGTMDVVKKARKRGIPVTVVTSEHHRG